MSYLNSYIKKLTETAIGQIKEINSKITHNGVKGTTNEKLLIELLSDYLPKKFEFLNSVILIDKQGDLSKETDVLIYDKTNVSTVFRQTDSPIFPIDLASMIITVKTTLNKAELKDAILNIKTIKQLKIIHGTKQKVHHISEDKRVISFFKHPPCIIVGFQSSKYSHNNKSATDVVGKLIDDILEIFKEQEISPNTTFDMIFILDEGLIGGWVDPQNHQKYVDPETWFLVGQKLDFRASTMINYKEEKQIQTIDDKSKALFKFMQLVEMSLSNHVTIGSGNLLNEYIPYADFVYGHLPSVWSKHENANNDLE